MSKPDFVLLLVFLKSIHYGTLVVISSRSDFQLDLPPDDVHLTILFVSCYISFGILSVAISLRDNEVSVPPTYLVNWSWLEEFFVVLRAMFEDILSSTWFLEQQVSHCFTSCGYSM